MKCAPVQAVKNRHFTCTGGSVARPDDEHFLVSCTHEIRSGRDGAHRCIRSGAFFAGSGVRVKKNFVSRSGLSRAGCARSEVSRSAALPPRFTTDPRRSREAGHAGSSAGAMPGMQYVAARPTGRLHIHQAPACASDSDVRPVASTARTGSVRIRHARAWPSIANRVCQCCPFGADVSGNSPVPTSAPRALCDNKKARYVVVSPGPLGPIWPHASIRPPVCISPTTDRAHPRERTRNDSTAALGAVQ